MLSSCGLHDVGAIEPAKAAEHGLIDPIEKFFVEIDGTSERVLPVIWGNPYTGSLCPLEHPGDGVNTYVYPKGDKS